MHVYVHVYGRGSTVLAFKCVTSLCRSYTGCPRRNVPNFGRVFLTLKYTDTTQNTYIQSWTVTEIMAGEVWNFDSCYTLIDYQIRIKTDRNIYIVEPERLNNSWPTLILDTKLTQCYLASIGAVYLFNISSNIILPTSECHKNWYWKYFLMQNSIRVSYLLGDSLPFPPLFQYPQDRRQPVNYNFAVYV